MAALALPCDVMNLIIRKLDIDTRRALNIYTRLKVPDELRRKLDGYIEKRMDNCVIFKVKRECYFMVLKELSSYYFFDTYDDLYNKYDLQTGETINIF